MSTDLHQREIDTYLALAHLRAALGLLPDSHPLRPVIQAATDQAAAHWRALQRSPAPVDQVAPRG